MLSWTCILHTRRANPPVGRTVRVELTGEKILQLLKTLEGRPVFQKNPLFPKLYNPPEQILYLPLPPPIKALLPEIGYPDFCMEGLDLEGAYFRPVYFNLEGGVDLSLSPLHESIGGSVSFYGVYLYKKLRRIWAPSFSGVVRVTVSS